VDPPPTGRLVPFIGAYASTVAGWVRSDDDLFTLAPRTMPPITPAKVLGWKREGGLPMLFIGPDGPDPIGYVELNPMPMSAAEWWIGHLLVAPAHRGRRVGRQIVDLLLDAAFLHHQAAQVSLMVFPDHAPAVRCYQGAGFEERGSLYPRFDSRPGAYRMVHMVIDRARYDALRQDPAAQSLRDPA
jgi:RimJ/RimL family protein N-acetyltransferase